MIETNTSKRIELKFHSQDLFNNGESYINSMRMYFSYFKTIPNIKAIEDIDAKRLRKWLDHDYKEQILKIHFRQEYSRRRKKMGYVNIMYLLKNELLLDIELGIARVLFEAGMEEPAQQLINEIKRFLVRNKRTQAIFLVIKDLHGLDIRGLKLKKPELSLNENYNTDLSPIHQTVLSSLRKKEKGGLILFHGSPGTGKSTYIRYLIHSLNKKVIFLPPRLAGNLDSPELVNLLFMHQNSVLVIEDAEELLIARENGNNSSISMLLNLTDGLLGESLGIQVIATFNTKISNIDKALLRKGRLIALYEFKALDITKANVLLESLGIKNYSASEPLTLAEIYNTQQDKFEFKVNQKGTIGFIKEVV